MDTAPPPLPPESASPPESPTPNDLCPERVAHDRDLYCLECGYNLRGLAGDPLCCPECGAANPVGLVEIPAELISQHLKRMESALALAALVGMLTLPFGLFFSVLAMQGGPIPPACFLIPLIFGGLTLCVGIAAFRELAGARPGWLVGAFRYYAVVTLLATLVFGFVMASMWLAAAVTGLRPERDGPAPLYVLLMCLALALTIFAIRRVGTPLRRSLLETIKPTQRGIAISVTREYLRAQQGRARRERRL